MSKKKRVAKNTLYMYIRMIITIVVTFYSIRIVLKALGVEDYGIYNLISGVIVMLSFINNAMVISIQRYLAQAIGAEDFSKLQKVFITSLIQQLILGFSLLCVLTILYPFLFNGFLNIPADRLPSARIVYVLMSIGVFFNILGVPHLALVSAHEDLKFEAFIGVFESLLRLFLAYLTLWTEYDKLVFYGLAIMISIITIRLIRFIFAVVHYKECRSIVFSFDGKLFKEMISFSGWNTLGAASGVLKSRGLDIIINIFFGVAINSAYGISYMVNAKLKDFSVNMLKAIRPQILKAEGSGEREKMLNLSAIASKYSVLLLAFPAIPLFFEMEYVLTLWLNDVPKYTVIFCQLILILSIINMATSGLQTAIQAIGDIKIYQLVLSFIYLLTIPVGWLVIKNGFPAYSILNVAIFFEILAGVFRIIFLKVRGGLHMKLYVKSVLFRVIISILVPVILQNIIINYIEQGFIRLVISTLSSIVIFSLSIYILGLEERDRVMLKTIIHKRFRR